MATCQELLSVLGCYISKQGSGLFELFEDKLTLSGRVLHITKTSGEKLLKFSCRIVFKRKKRTNCFQA